MGSGDIILQHNTHQGGTLVDVDSSPWIQHTGQPGAKTNPEGLKWQSLEGGYYKPVNKFIPSGDWIIWNVVFHSQSTSAANNGGLGMFIKVGDAWYYIRGNMDGTSTMKLEYRSPPSRPSINNDPPDGEDSTYVGTDGRYLAFGLKFKTNGKIDFLVGDEWPGAGGYVDIPDDATIRASLSVVKSDILTWSGNTISEVGMVFAKVVINSTQAYFWRMHVDAEDDLQTVGGDLTDPGFVELHSKSFIGTIGNATGRVDEQSLANMATHISNIGKYINVIMSNGNIAFQGEMRRPKNTGPHKLQYEFVHNGQKFNRMDGATNPEIESRFVRYLDWVEPDNDNFLHDNNEVFPNYSTRIAVFQNSNLKKKTYHAAFVEDNYARDIINSEQSSPSPGASVVPGTVSGIPGRLYFFDADEPTDNSDLAEATANQWASEMQPDVADHKSLAEILQFDAFLDDDPATASYISKITITLIVSFRRLNRYVFSSNPDDNTYPLILLLNPGTGNYDTIKIIQSSDAGGSSKIKANDDIFGEDETPNMNFTIVLTESQIAAAFEFIEDNGTTEQWRAKIAVRSGIASSIQILGNHTVHIRQAQMDIEFVANESEHQGHFNIDIPTGDNAILQLAVSAGLPLYPSPSGFSAGDSFKIVPTVEDYITDLYTTIKASKSLIWDLDLNLTGADIWGMVANFADKYIVNVLQDVTGRFNGIWYIDEDANTLVIKSVDNLVTASKTITLAIALDNTLYFDIDGTKITNEVTVLGKNNKVSQVVSASALSLGLETTIEVDPSLIDLGSVQNRADDIKKRTQTLLNAFAIKVDIDDDDYTEFKKGVLVPVKLPSVADPSWMDDTLMIIGLEYKKGVSTAQKGILAVHVRKRFS